MANFLYSLSHSPIIAHFSKNSTDFVVREVPLYEFSNDGEHAVILIEKKDLTTSQALGIFSEILGVKMRDFGYCGLKDKEGLTSQFISFPAKFEQNLNKFSHEKIKILSQTRHKNKLKIGHLKGNNFFIRLKKVGSIEAKKIDDAISNIAKNGFANYFGYQRFGKFKDNFQQGLAILKGEKRLKNPKMQNFLISAFQSELFNRYLAKRVEISKMASEFSPAEFAKIYNFDKGTAKILQNQPQFYKLLPGEILGHFPFGKFFLCENLEQENERFLKKDITSCGLLFGNVKPRAESLAQNFENEIFSEFDEFLPKLNGTYRYLWSFASDIKGKYNENLAQYSLSFYLSKGSYATVLLEEILHHDIFESYQEEI